MIISVENLGLKFGDNLIFKHLSFELAKGEILAVKGGNGSGKSSLCLCLGGLLEPDPPDVKFRGQVLYDGKNVLDMSVADRARAVGLIFQNPDNQLFSPLVIEELAFAPENLAVPREEIKKRVDNALAVCGIEHLKNASTSTLSGGEKQLVAIASVLTMQPEVLIADEITSRIDTDRKDTVRKILKDFAASGGIVVIVSHNERDLDIASRFITLERGKNYANRT